MEEIPMVKPKKILQTILPVLAAAFLLSLILNWLYHKDNKYTHKGTQAISGVLILDNGTLDQSGRICKPNSGSDFARERDAVFARQLRRVSGS